jgi:hypothetical protein
MRILVHTDAQAFADLVRPLLAEEEALNVLPLGLLGRPAEGSDRSSWWTVRTGGVTAGAVLRTPPWPWTVSRFSGDRDRFTHVVGDRLGTHADLPGEVHGARELALAVAERWAERVGGSAELTMRMRVMACTDLRPATAPGAARAIGQGDVQWVADWLRAFEDEIGLAPTSPSIDVTRATVARDVEQGRSPLWVWEVGASLSVWPASVGRHQRANGSGRSTPLHGTEAVATPAHWSPDSSSRRSSGAGNASGCSRTPQTPPATPSTSGSATSRSVMPPTSRSCHGQVTHQRGRSASRHPRPSRRRQGCGRPCRRGVVDFDLVPGAR